MTFTLKRLSVHNICLNLPRFHDGFLKKIRCVTERLNAKYCEDFLKIANSWMYRRLRHLRQRTTTVPLWIEGLWWHYKCKAFRQKRECEIQSLLHTKLTENALLQGVKTYTPCFDIYKSSIIYIIYDGKIQVYKQDVWIS
ncbi:uncharacterized protein [Ptychodera flava]|uniref:uncharacterized protein n=1 Tax=Ptychodera flava TaxID=63121 RepID=UPI00396A5B00